MKEKFSKFCLGLKWNPYSRLMLVIGFLFLLKSGIAHPIQISEDHDRYFIKSQLEYWHSPNPLVFNPDALPQDQFKPLKDYNNYIYGGTWLRFKINFSNWADTLYLVSERNNIIYDFHFFQQKHAKQWELKQSDYHQPKSHPNQPWGRVVFEIPPKEGIQTFYLALEGKVSGSPELVLFTKKGLEKHTRKVSRTVLFYGSVVILILFFALLIGIFFRIKIAFLLAFYVFCTATLSLLEFIVYFIPNRPDLTDLLNRYLFPLFVLSFLFYSMEFLQLGKLPKWGKQIYWGLIIGVLLYLLGLKWISPFHQFDLIIASLLGYGTMAVFVFMAFYSWKSNKPILWFIAGALLVVFTVLLIDLHDRNIIFAPQVFEWFYPMLILELILIAIGTLLGVKQKARELELANTENTRLKENLQNLQQEVVQSQSAFQTLANRKAKTPLTAPPEYYNNPLSTRELQVLRLLSQGLTNLEISKQIHLSRNTIKTHLKNIYQKLDTNNRKEAAKKAQEYGLIE